MRPPCSYVALATIFRFVFDMPGRADRRPLITDPLPAVGGGASRVLGAMVAARTEAERALRLSLSGPPGWISESPSSGEVATDHELDNHGADETTDSSSSRRRRSTY